MGESLEKGGLDSFQIYGGGGGGGLAKKGMFLRERLIPHCTLWNLVNSLSDNPTKWSNTHEQFVGYCRRIV